MPTGTLILFVLGLAFVALGAGLFVRGASRLAIVMGVSSLVIGLTVVAYGTSAPELAVSLHASLSGVDDIAVGNVVGSNIYNVLLILGLASVVAPLGVSRQLVRWDVPLMIGISLLLWVMAFDGRLGRVDGLILFAGSVAYTTWTIRQSRKETRQANSLSSETTPAPGQTSVFNRWLVPIAYVVVGVAFLVTGAHWVKNGAVDIARYFDISELIIALTIVAVGTSLPEIATSVAAGIRGERDLAVGNAVGSNIFNILLVLGLTAVVAPQGIQVPAVALRFDMPIMIAVAISCLPIFFTGSVISRKEGAFFLLYYVAYTLYLIFRAEDHASMTPFDTMMMIFVAPLAVITLLLVLTRVARARRRSVAR